MATHSVKFTIPYRDLGKSDVEFNVNKNGEKLGTLEISKGSIVWYPKDTSYGHKVGWTRFDKFMLQMPKVEKRKKN